MFEIKEAIGDNVLLTVIDSNGNVVFHETVKSEEAEKIGERLVSVIK